MFAEHVSPITCCNSANSCNTLKGENLNNGNKVISIITEIGNLTILERHQSLSASVGNFSLSSANFASVDEIYFAFKLC